MEQELLISSTWTNVINAVIFEIILIAGIYYFTADVCARLNYLSLVDGSVQGLVVISPPLLGGGIISTSRKRSIFMIILRAVGVLLIFGTALTIDGATVDQHVKDTKQVRVLEPMSNDTNQTQLQELSHLRATCMGTINETLIFGRLDADKYCEIDNRLLENAISFKISTETINISISNGCTYKRVYYRQRNNVTQGFHATTTCKHGIQRASILCFQIVVNNKTVSSRCGGSFRLSDNAWYTCELFEGIFSRPSINTSSNCQVARNIDKVHSLWPEAAIVNRVTNVIESIGALSIKGVEEQQVTFIRPKDITKVHNMWFLCLALKLALLLILGVYSIRLRIMRAHRILNDDRALLALLRRKLNDWFGPTNDNDNPIYLHMNRSNEGEKLVWASMAPNYNPGGNGEE